MRVVFHYSDVRKRQNIAESPFDFSAFKKMNPNEFLWFRYPLRYFENDR